MLQQNGQLLGQFMENGKSLKITGLFVFLFSTITYLITMAPAVSFWDCGEFITCSYLLGVPHPPGAPLYLIIGRVFTFLGFIPDIGVRVNLLSVLSSSFTILLLFLTTVRLIEEWRGKGQTITDKFINYTGGVLAAISFNFTDTFWFNAVEAEVYAFSMFLTALVLWLAFVWLENLKDYRSTRFLLFIVYLFGLAMGVHLLNLLVIPSILLLIFFYDRRLLIRFDLWAFVPVLLLLGYSTYIFIFIRSGLNPVIDENNPETLTNFASYLKREQYGEDPIFSLFSRKAPLWEYQIKKMYLRYFSWQFIGKGIERGADRFITDNFSFRGLYGLPFAVGIFGMFYHFVKDWKKALIVLVAFIMTGVAIVIYLNQPNPQPRERDYVFVGSFYAFAVWLGTGVSGTLELIKNLLKNRERFIRPAFFAATAVFAFIMPVNLMSFNFDEHDRSGQYLAWDYSYNILQSCEKDAILFTNGDNDTFPVWYLQFVEGIRTDVKVVNLALINTSWYIMQMKHKFGVPSRLSDEQIKNILPVEWPQKRTIVFKISNQIINAYMNDSSEEKNIAEENELYEMSFDVEPTLAGRAIRIQDRMIIDILVANNWKKPVYFAVTVPANNTIGLYKKNFRLDGMVYKVVPKSGGVVDGDILYENTFNKYKYRNLDNPDVFFNFEKKDLAQNYRNAFINLAIHFYNKKENEKTIAILDKMEEVVPRSVIMIKQHVVMDRIATIYYNLGRIETHDEIVSEIINNYTIPEDLLNQFANRFLRYSKNFEKALETSLSLVEKKPDNQQYCILVVHSYEGMEKYQEAIDYIDNWTGKYPDQKNAFSKIKEDLAAKLSKQ